MKKELLRADFPILKQEVNGMQLIYLDNGATTQMPLSVMEAMKEQCCKFEANVHRGIHSLSEQSTARLEHVRIQVQKLLHATYPEEIIFTSGATGSLNLIARAFSFGILKPGDEVITTAMEHHANLIPWQEACRRTGAKLLVVPLLESGDLDMSTFRDMLSDRTKLVAVTAVSNVTGAVTPIEEIITLAHGVGAQVLVDACQGMRHRRFDVQALGCDYLAFSAHKIMGPTGVGVLYGKKELLEMLPPENYGGGMVDDVEIDHATWGALPFKLEAGTPNIVGIIGFGAALDYLAQVGWESIYKQEFELTSYVRAVLKSIPGVAMVGNPDKCAGAVSFNLDGFHYFDVAKLLDQLGVAVRSGHHCAQPLLKCFGLTGAVRVSPAFYNTEEEIDAFASALIRVSETLKRRSSNEPCRTRIARHKS